MALDKLVDSTKLDACLDAEADAIRAKTGGASDIPFDYANNKGFADAIAAIPSAPDHFTLIDTYTVTEDVRVLVMDITDHPYNKYIIDANASGNGADYLYVGFDSNVISVNNRSLYYTGNSYSGMVMLSLLRKGTNIGDVQTDSAYSIGGSAGAARITTSDQTLTNNPTDIFAFAYRPNGVINAGSTFKLYGGY